MSDYLYRILEDLKEVNLILLYADQEDHVEYSELIEKLRSRKLELFQLTILRIRSMNT